jgi:hypothetical protein
MGLFSLDHSIDLGTANTLVKFAVRVMCSTSLHGWPFVKRTRRSLAVGAHGQGNVGRTRQMSRHPSIRDGVISEFEIPGDCLTTSLARLIADLCSHAASAGCGWNSVAQPKWKSARSMTHPWLRERARRTVRRARAASAWGGFTYL